MVVILSLCMHMYIIDQVRGQNGLILDKFSFCVFMDQDKDLSSCLFSSTEKEASFMQK